MATPMTLPDVCCLCWGPHGGGTFDVHPVDGLVLVDVCADCRMKEVVLAIRLRAG